jgi:polyisoprenoid-binding protein YceI
VKAVVAVLSAWFAMSPPAGAAEYRDGDGSTLAFASSYDGEPFDGAFARFDVSLRFDPADPAAGRLDVRIDLASAGTGHDERDEVLVGDEFLAAAAQPVARYVAEGFRALGGGRYAADGLLTLRGASRPVTFEFSWTPGAPPVLAGAAVVPRLAFGVGEGDWADTSLLPDAVRVTTRVVLEPVR